MYKTMKLLYKSKRMRKYLIAGATIIGCLTIVKNCDPIRDLVRDFYLSRPTNEAYNKNINSKRKKLTEELQNKINEYMLSVEKKEN